jgi:hypothetical protein
MEQGYQGSCLCGAIKFRIKEFMPQVGHCHCIMCRKFHGAAYSTFAGAKLEHIEWLSGSEKLTNFKAENGTTRQFCSACGSSLTFQGSKVSDSVEFALAAFDTPVDLTPDAHIFVDFKAPWSTICEGERQYAEGRSSTIRKG